MKSAITLLLLALSCNIQAAVTFDKAKSVFLKLERASGRYIPFGLSRGRDVNASTTYRGITITKGMLKFVNSEDELASILGHEIGHWINHDYINPFNLKFHELRADAIGYNLCLQAGYSNCLRSLYHMRQVFGEEGNDGIHPKWSDRIRFVLQHSREYYEYKY